MLLETYFAEELDTSGAVSGGELMRNMPHYMTSVVDSVQSVGYEGTIPPEYIKPIKKIWYEEEDGEYDLYEEEL